MMGYTKFLNPAENDQRATLLAVMGATCAGKTSAARMLRVTNDGRLISLEEIRAQLSPWNECWDPSTTKRALRRVHRELDRHLAENTKVIIDMPYMDKHDRDKLLEIADRNTASPLAVLCMPTLEETLRRNKKRPELVGQCGSPYRLPVDTISAQHQAIIDDFPLLPAEGWSGIAVMR